ncbi:MAG: rod shape-determining protein MreD [Syntrophotaleaceae bacterium]
MKSLPGYLILGLGLLFLQSAVLPHLLPFHLKPGFLLVLAIYLSFHETRIRAGITCYLLGLMQDTFAGEFLGLYGLVFLIISLVVKSVAGRLNTESPLLLLFMVACGTLLEGVLLIFSLGFFTDAGQSWRLIVGDQLLQVLLNLVAAGLILKFFSMLPRRGKNHLFFLRPFPPLT